MRWPKYWSFSFSIIPSKEIPGLISFRMDWLDLGSNKPCAHQDPETELCLSVSYGGMGQQWTAAGTGALGAVDLGMA